MLDNGYPANLKADTSYTGRWISGAAGYRISARIFGYFLPLGNDFFEEYILHFL